jgi:SHS2 domain-containing protein
MGGSYKFIDHTADIAVELKADSIEELFIVSAKAFNEAVTEFEAKDETGNLNFVLSSHSLETLLVSFLNELNFRLINKRKISVNINNVKITQNNENWNLQCILQENDIDEESIKTEIKSVTYHQIEIKKEDGKYSTSIVFDI